MKDEWTQVNRAGQLVKFTYDDLPHGKAFLTAQIAGHEVVCSAFCSKRNSHSVMKALKVTSSTEPTSDYGLVQSSPLPEISLRPCFPLLQQPIDLGDEHEDLRGISFDRGEVTQLEPGFSGLRLHETFLQGCECGAGPDHTAINPLSF